MNNITILSLNINSLSKAKLNEITKFDTDIILLQEIRVTTINKIIELHFPGYDFFYSTENYSGLAIYIKSSLKGFTKPVTHREGRIMSFEFIGEGMKEPLYIFNVYHKRLSNNMSERLEYDQTLIDVMSQYKNKKVLLLGDLNSTFRLHDSANNENLQEDLNRKPPDDWELTKPFNPKMGCYEKHFMSLFLRKCCLKDNGYQKGYTVKKRDSTDKMRIDYCLTNNFEISTYNVVNIGINNTISDHKAIIVTF